MSTGYDVARDLFVQESRPRFPWVNVGLFVLTFFTTLFVGSVLMADFHHTLGGQPDLELDALWKNPWFLLGGLPYSIAIMTILFAHEMGHYLTCKY